MRSTEGPEASTGVHEDALLFSTLTFFGFSLFLAWCFWCLFGFSSLLEDLVDNGADYLCFEAVFFSVFALTMAVSGLLADRFELFPNIRIVVACAVFIALATVPLLLISSLPLGASEKSGALLAFFVVGCLISAFTAYFFLCWLSLLGRTVTSMTAILYAAATAIAALIGFLILTLEYPFGELLVLLLLLSQALVMIVVAKSVPRQERPVLRKESSARRPLYWKTHLTFDAFGLVFGLMFFSLSASASSPALFTLAVCAGAIVAAADVWQAGGVYVERLRRYAFLVMM
ncbi:MAG: hypothetical protein LBP28_09135, partial [Coriobacteriales bacterium]|nr:hypothetical protein [Coriobacteriales bacterium]